jgi:hypothetical protein
MSSINNSTLTIARMVSRSVIKAWGYAVEETGYTRWCKVKW